MATLFRAFLLTHLMTTQQPASTVGFHHMYHIMNVIGAQRFFPAMDLERSELIREPKQKKSVLEAGDKYLQVCGLVHMYIHR